MFEYLPVPVELLVLGLAFLLYTTDLARLLSANEVLFCGTIGGRWRALTPFDGLWFNRRHAVFPRIYDGGSVEFRVKWPSTTDASQPDAKFVLSGIQRDLVLERMICRALVAQFFIGIPVAYMMPSNDLPTLAVIALIYLQVTVVLVSLWLKRDQLGLPAGRVAWLAFESLVCLPYSLNLHRKVAAQITSRQRMDVLSLADQLLEPDAKRLLGETLRRSVEHQREWQPELAGEHLDAFARRLSAFDKNPG